MTLFNAFPLRFSTILFFLFAWLFVRDLATPYVQFAAGDVGIPVHGAVFMVSAILLFFDLTRRSLYGIRFLLVLLAFVLIITPSLSVQIIAHQRVPHVGIHDGAVQTEAALRFLREGENPYAADYRQTPFGRFPAFRVLGEPEIDNPAYEHYIYLPGYLLTSLPFFMLFDAVGGYDQRISHGLFFVLALFVLLACARTPETKLSAAVAFAFHPLFLRQFLGGYNDIQTLAPVFLSLFLLARGRIRWAAVALGFALAIKQSAWLLAPLFFVFLFARLPRTMPLLGRLRTVFFQGWPALAVSGALILPFFLWSPQAFLADTIRYPAGSIEGNFPITGFSIGSILVRTGVISSPSDPYPFWIWQAAVGLPLFLFLLRWQLRDNTVTRLAVSYALLLLVFWFFSRFLFENYLAYLSLILLFAFFLDERERVMSL